MATLIGFAPVKTCGFPDFGPDSEGHMGFVRGEPWDSKAGVGLQNGTNVGVESIGTPKTLD